MNMSVEESDRAKMNTIPKEGSLTHSQAIGRNGVVQISNVQESGGAKMNTMPKEGEPTHSQTTIVGSNGVVQALLTDLYQITMAYAYWKSGKMNDPSVFDLYFRKNPFQGEFTIFAGLEECVKLLQCFHFSESDISYLKTALPQNTDPEFYVYLKNLSARDVTLSGVPEGEVVFPKVPLLTVKGPLAVVQLLETPLLNLVNYASLVATNAARFRIAAGPDTTLLEFGLRRAQGPDGGLSASRYCYLGGFDGTSNVLAGKMFGIPVKGTHAHAFVTSFINLSDVKTRTLKSLDGTKEIDFVDLCLKYQIELTSVINFLPDQVMEGELAAFISYALAFPESFLALIDTYDVIRSGLPNFCTVAMALNDLGYQAKGIRLDSGDLSYLSKLVQKNFVKVANYYKLPWFENMTIVASNDINEDTIHSLNQQGHNINCYGIGTHLVTCQKQPALGCVFKLVQINTKARIKLSEDVEKVTIPGLKNVYRLFGSDGTALVDLLQESSEPPPKMGERVLCRHPIQESKRAYVIPASVRCLHEIWWKDGKVVRYLPSLTELREKAKQSLSTIRQDHKRTLNPTPYKVSVSSSLYTFIHELWLESAPIGELY
ncbi:nicotinate phosphoribosyltransferase-like [Physella acuta]|uniref:nicotinate phosphoribosyltransferase-like n=1 Tax=Physella acuta TaxID=109671 RepID=UPI0027DC1FF8|nr:nicotinate phosphoribosyltransferase-like [Physella acuta]